MTLKDNYVVSVKGEVCPPAIIIIHSTNVEVVTLMSLVECKKMGINTTIYCGFETKTDLK